MNKNMMLMCAAFICSVLGVNGTVTHNITAAYMYENDGSTPLSAGSTIVLLADANNNGFGDLTQATSAWTADAGDVIIGRYALDADNGAGSDLEALSFSLTGGIDTGDPLMLVWYDTPYSAEAAGPGENVHFGTFRSDIADLDGSHRDWTVGADGGGYNLNFLTTSAGGSNPESAGMASFQTIPEPATALLAFIGAGLAWASRRAKRFHNYES
jgi:hypothetical protein